MGRVRTFCVIPPSLVPNPNFYPNPNSNLNPSPNPNPNSNHNPNIKLGKLYHKMCELYLFSDTYTPFLNFSSLPVNY